MPVIPYVRQTWTDGSSSASAARMGVLESGIFETSLAPAVRVYHSAAQSLTTGVELALAFNSERFDRAGGAASTQHDTATNNSRLTALYVGAYQISGTVQFASNVTGLRWVRIRLNGATILAHTSVPSGLSGTATRLSVSTLYDFAINDYVELVVRQDSGGALDVETLAQSSPEFMMVRVA
jgi:hypothetical protein